MTLKPYVSQFYTPAHPFHDPHSQNVHEITHQSHPSTPFPPAPRRRDFRIQLQNLLLARIHLASWLLNHNFDSMLDSSCYNQFVLQAQHIKQKMATAVLQSPSAAIGVGRNVLEERWNALDDDQLLRQIERYRNTISVLNRILEGAEGIPNQINHLYHNFFHAKISKFCLILQS